MKLPDSRVIKPILLAAVIVALSFLKDLLMEMTGSKLGDYLHAKFGISTTALVYTLISVLLVFFLFAIYDAFKNRSGEGEPKAITGNIEPEVEMLLDSLKERYQNRYKQKLDGRFEITLEVGEAWNGRATRVIREEFDSDANVGEAAEVINRAFTEKGGLLIVGNPGAGKTVLLLKLAITLLDKTDSSGGSAFPVIFNLASWSPEYERFEDWLRDALESGYGLSGEFAETLLHQERIILLLDGLDELGRGEDEKVAAEMRGECLKSLNHYLSRGKKVVICCRRDEFVRISKLKGQDAPVSARVALLDLTKNQIEHALSEAVSHTGSKGNKTDATSAGHILEFLKLRKGKALLETLRTPFYFTTALEVFDKPILEDEHLPKQADELKRYLLDKFVQTKLYRTPNPNKFDPLKTRWWLTWVAIVGMSKDQVTFELSDLQMYHLEAQTFHTIFTGVCFGLIAELYVIGMLGTAFWGLGFLAGCLLVQMAALLGLFRRQIVTEDIRHWNFRNILRWAIWARWLKFIFVATMLSGLLGSLLIKKMGPTTLSLFQGFLFAALPAFLMLSIQVSINASKDISFYTHLKTPYQRLSAGVGFTLTKFLILGVLLSFVILYELNMTKLHVLFFGSMLCVFSGFMTTPLFRHLILRLCLRIEGKLPMRCATFLDYAAEARILEKDGGQWRFRHQNLQDYFARGEYLEELKTKARKRTAKSKGIPGKKNRTV